VFNKTEKIFTDIKKWINILQHLDLNHNPSIGLMIELDPDYFCIIAAAIEIGANFVVLDGRFDERSSHRPFLPLDLLIYDKSTVNIMVDDMNYWKQNAIKLIDRDEICVDNRNVVVKQFDKQHYKMLSASTSGTTGKPKPIFHSYQYILDIAHRNARVLKFDGRVAHIKNLYHGSSLPVFFLPSLMTSNFHWCAPWTNLGDFQGIESYINTTLRHAELFDINHILFPHSFMLDKFLQAVIDLDLYFSNLKLYTLTYIKPIYKKYIKDRNIEIISIFGCTETSGPIMINRLSNLNIETFDPTIFFTLDDFFKITCMQDGTLIQSSNQFINHFMTDKFEQLSPNSYKHLGRSEMFRINDITFSVNNIIQIPLDLSLDADIVPDYVNEKLYLAIWDQSDLAETLSLVNHELKKIDASDILSIDQKSAKILDKNNFMSGIKIDNEKLRKYFNENN